MATETANELMQLIQKLKDERKEYEAKIAEIDATFEKLGMEIPGVAPAAAGPGRPAGRPAGRKRKVFEQTAEQSVLGYLNDNPNSTSADVNGHWTDEGRSGRADNTLTKLVKAGKIKRTPIPGQSRGGTYTVMG